MCTAEYPSSLLQHKNIHWKFTFTKKQIHQEAGDINKNALLVVFTPERLYMITAVFTILFRGTITEMGTSLVVFNPNRTTYKITAVLSTLIRASRTKMDTVI